MLIYERTTNIGDAIQTVAITRLLGGVSAGIFRDAPIPELCTEVPFVVNGWLGWGSAASDGNCLFAGVHLGHREPEYVPWIRKSRYPVGARDEYTRGFLAANRIAAQTIGCATLTLPRYLGPRHGRYSIDVAPLPGTQFETSIIADLRWADPWDLALHRLDQLRTAEIVYTRRIHVVLPCLAFGTPVVFPAREFRDLFDKSRLSILHDIGFVYDEPVEMDVTPLADRFVRFLSEALQTTLQPVDRPAMPIPIVDAGRAGPAPSAEPPATASLPVPVQPILKPAPSVSALVMTRNGGDRLARCLESIRQTGFATDLVVCVDSSTTDASVELALSFTSHVHLVRGGYPEMVISRLIPLCPSDYVLHLADDEQLGGNWDRTQFELLAAVNDITHFWTPRRWVVPPGDRFIVSGPWFPDLQMRLFLNNPHIVTCPTRVHEHLKVRGRSLALYDRWIEHSMLVLHSRLEREAKCRHYLDLRPDYDLSDFYLYEDKPVTTMPLNTPALLPAGSPHTMKPFRSVVFYEPGSLVDFRAGGNAAAYTLGGWNVPESWGTWTAGDSAAVCLPLEGIMGSEAALVVALRPFITRRHPVCRAQVLYFGDLIAEWSFHSPAPKEKRIELPASLISNDRSPSFTFRILNPASPLELNESDDPRQLGLGFTSLRLLPGTRRPL